MTTARASIHARLWIADESDPEFKVLTPVEVDALKSWVRARCLAEGDPGQYSDPAAHLTSVLVSELGLTDEEAEQLIDASEGWPL